jgi:hypothetical protein
MFERKPKAPEGPVLLDRIVRSGCRRVAVLGLHPAAGTRTVVSSLVRELHKRSLPFGVTSAPRLPLEVEMEADSRRQPVTVLALPEGAWLATGVDAAARAEAGVHLQEQTLSKTPLGLVGLYRVFRGGEVGLHGPPDHAGMAEVTKRLRDCSDGVVLVDGAWERRAFAAPGAADGIVLVVGAGHAPTPERSAAAARYVVETLTVPPCGEPAGAAWQDVASQGAAAMLDATGKMIGVLPPGLEDPVPAMRTPDGGPIAGLVMPHGLNDEFMIPLVRASFRCELVVRDSTRINVAPIYFKAWLKGGGQFRVVRPMRLIAVASNPSSATGPDADPERFREQLSRTFPELPVHDVVLESGEEHRKPVWRFWE